MHVATIRRRHGDRVYESHLVRRSFREGKRVRHETIANVSRLPPAAIEALRRALRGEALMAAGEAFAIEDPLPHGHVEALLAAARRLGLARLLDRAPSRERGWALALICGRVIAPGSKLATARALSRSTVAAELSVEGADQDDLYAAMDWLLERQQPIEGRLARRHLQDGELVLYDVSSSYFEGRTCPLAELGFSRDGKRGTAQVVCFAFERKSGQIEAEAALDGIYVIRTSVADDTLDAPDVVRSYKQLKEVERPPLVQGAARGAPDPPPPRGPRARPPLPVHARLLPRVAPAPGLGRAAVQRRAPADPDRPRRQGHPLRRRRTQGAHQAHHRRPALPLLPQPARRTRAAHPQHNPPNTAPTPPSPNYPSPPSCTHARSPSSSASPTTRSHEPNTAHRAKRRRHLRSKPPRAR